MTARIRTVLLTCVLALAGVATAAPTTSAKQVFWSKAELLKSFFAECQRVTYRKVELDAEARLRLRKRLGYAAPARQTIYYGLDRAGEVAGYAIIDDEMGQHLPITFGVLVDATGHAQRVEVMVYREAHGGEVQEPRFRQQFAGKTVADPVRQGRDITAITGATISSKAIARGVRRALILVDELILVPGLRLAGAR